LFSHSYNRDFVCGLRQEEESSKGIIGIPWGGQQRKNLFLCTVSQLTFGGLCSKVSP
jgi:hypothetical protein